MILIHVPNMPGKDLVLVLLHSKLIICRVRVYSRYDESNYLHDLSISTKMIISRFKNTDCILDSSHVLYDLSVSYIKMYCKGTDQAIHRSVCTASAHTSYPRL